MTITTVTSREFNQDVSRLKHLTEKGPVFITDRGHLAHVLLTIEKYQQLTKQQENIVDLLAMPSSDKIDFAPTKIKKKLYRAEEFT